jgi:hypothetical protein
MNNLYTFGCSFTEDFEVHNNKTTNSPQSRYIFEILNGIVPDSWVDIVSKKLNLTKKNYSIGGDCNYGIFEQICKYCDEFCENDVIIIEWTNVHRFRWPNMENKWRSRLPGYFSDYDGISKNTYEEILVNRSHKLWYDEIYHYEKIIDRLCSLNKCKIFYWSFDPNLIYTLPDEIRLQKKYLLIDEINEDLYSLVRNRGGQSINDESNGKINDGHLGKTGHEVLGELIYKDIINKI